MEKCTIEEIIEKHLPEDALRQARMLLFGREPETLKLPRYEKNEELEVKGFKLNGSVKEQLRPARIVRVAMIQNTISVSTTRPLQEQRDALFQKISNYIEHAIACKANIICLQEVWSMPYIFCTREKYPWCEMAEDAENGPSTSLLRKIAQQNNVVIVNPIFERDCANGETLWNTTVIIDADGKVLGKHRKNHIPRMYYNESSYYVGGNLGHQVFDTTFGKIGVVVCHGRLYPMNWMMQGINGAEIVFCPSAAISDVEESLWSIHGRCAAVANNFYTCNINRVGLEEHINQFTAGDGRPPQKHFGQFFGSCYVAAPDGTRTPGLCRNRDGLLITELDLNLCRQAKDIWGLRMTQRLEHYAEEIMKATKKDFKPHVVSK